MIRLVCLAAALVGLAGCGLIDADIAEIDLELPERQVIVDTADWELTDEGKMPAVACAETRRDCAPQVEMWCGAAEICDARCGGDSTCEVDVSVALWHTVDLTQLEALADLPAPVVAVLVDRIAVEITENTLNMDSPALTVAIGPLGTITSDGKDALEIGTIPSIDEGHTLPETDLELAPDGQAILADQLLHYETPFNLIVGSLVSLRAGDEVPSGRMVARIRVDARARTGL